MSNSLYTPQQDQFIISNVNSLTFKKIGLKLGKTRHQVRGRYLQLVKKGPQLSPCSSEHQSNSTAGRPEITIECTEGAQVVTTNSGTIRTKDDLLKVAKVDLNVWEVEKFVVNKWDSIATVKSERVNHTTTKKTMAATELWQVKVWLRRKTQVPLVEVKSELLGELAKYAAKMPKFVTSKPAVRSGDRHMLEVSIFDLHFGKLAWAPETDEDYDYKIASDRFRYAIDSMIKHCSPYAIESILFPIGNDFFHFDTTMGTTTMGTRMDTDSRWKKLFVKGNLLLREGIDKLSRIAPVQVIVVPGNHDTQMMFCAGEVLSAFYHKSNTVHVDNSPKSRKYHRYGVNLLGFTHGDKEKHRDLPLIMAQEMPDAWAATNGGSREWHLGHLHRRSESFYKASQDDHGVNVRVIPSLSGTDAWHYEQGYVANKKAAECYLWHPKNGYTGHFSAGIYDQKK